MNNWLLLKRKQQVDLYNQVGAETGLPSFAIEKDAWVTLVLRMLFSSKISDYIVFKGGTSLSKVYNLIERFSEDVDLAIDRTYFGFEDELTKGDIRRLRRRSHDFAFNDLPKILRTQFDEYGVDSKLYEIVVPNTEISDQDPEIVHINYKSVFSEEAYLPNRVQVEIGARSLNKPFDRKRIKSLIDTVFPESTFLERPFEVKSIIPQKTFLEKMILLHEEFQKPKGKIRSFQNVPAPI
ncbi:MAG: nucleotidyl transferase AbiEii/AbiGii toxin family protein [Bacteroidales bacterium]|nr:nucleotidyl transferase AbiEii/AbiGii toxin family protein [Bacteroidales bacterium]